jgi:competence protein ComGC
MKNLKKVIKVALVISPIVVLASCNSNKAKYEDLATGEKVYIIKDSQTGMAMDSISQKPVMFYVDLDTKDTINGKTGEVVNNKIVKDVEGKYEMAKSDLEQQIDNMKSEDDVKIKVENDGDYKIKTDDKKIKIEDGKVKIKTDKN